mgnify:CR=1 FL=1
MNSQIIPVLPLRDIVVFPQMVVPLFVGRKLSVNALNNVMKYNKKILLIAQNNSEIDNPTSENLYRVGTLAKILQLLKLPDGTIKVLVEGLERVKVSKIHQTKDFIIANYSFIKPVDKNVSKAKALMKIILEQFESYHKINKKIPIESFNNIRSNIDSDKFADVLVANLNISLSQKQELLEIISTVKRLEKIHDYLTKSGLQTKMLLQVHDELVFDLHRDETKTLPPLVAQQMREAMPMQVPIEVEMGTGETWLEAH